MENFLLGEGDSEAIFRHVKGLESSQRKHFSLLFKPDVGKKKPLFYQLYEAMIKREVFDELILRKSIPSKDFRKVLQILIEKLIYAQMFHDKEEKPRLYLIESALNLGAIEGVRKALTEELQTALRQEAFEDMFRMLGWVNAARRIYGINLIPDLDDNFPTRRQIVDHLSFEMELSELLDACEIGFEFASPHRGTLILRMSELVTKAKTHFHFPSRKCSYLLRRLQVRACLFGEAAADALQEQAILVKQMLSFRIYSNGEIYREVLLFIHLLAGSRLDKDAFRTLENMESLPVDTPVEANLHFQFVQKAKVGIALYNWDLDLGLEAHIGLTERPDVFRPHHFVDLSLKIATLLFVHGRMKDASRHLRDLIQHPAVETYEVRIWAELLLIATYHDRGEAELAYDAWRAAKSVVEKAELPYASMVYALLGKVLDTLSLSEEVEVVEAFRQEFMAVVKEGSNAICLPLFDVMQWFEARRRKLTCFALNQAGDDLWVWDGNFQSLDLAGSLGGVVYPVGGL